MGDRGEHRRRGAVESVKMKVRFLALSAGASGIIRPGDIVEVSDSEAKLLISCGYADAVESVKPEVKAEPTPEPKRGRKK